MRITHIIETHVQADHVSGARRLAEATGAPIFMHEAADVRFPHTDMADEDRLDLGNVGLRVLATPGHTPDGVSLLVTDRSRATEPWFILIGDTLFSGGVGRPDLLGSGAERGLAESLYDSLHGRLLALPDHLEVYPAHFGGAACGKGLSGKPGSTIGFERRFNPALKYGSREEFVRFVIGWLFALPVPFLIIFAPAWWWIDLANVLLGANQAMAWSMTVIMKVDLVGPRRRGLALGLNEFSGYVAVGLMSWITGFIAGHWGLRPYPFYLGIGIAVVGLVVSVLAVRETRGHVALESIAAPAPSTSETPRLGRIFYVTSLGNVSLFAACQAGLVNNLNDGMSWGLFPLFFAAHGLPVEQIGVVKAAYPLTWGLLQVATGPLSDRIGRRGLIAGGMVVQAIGIWLTVLVPEYSAWLVGAVLQGAGT